MANVCINRNLSGAAFHSRCPRKGETDQEKSGSRLSQADHRLMMQLLSGIGSQATRAAGKSACGVPDMRRTDMCRSVREEANCMDAKGLSSKCGMVCSIVCKDVHRHHGWLKSAGACRYKDELWSFRYRVRMDMACFLVRL